MVAGRMVVALWAVFALSVSAGCAQMATQAHDGSPRNRVVLQVSDNNPAKWNLALNNAHNLVSALGAANVDVEIVAYGPGIGMLENHSAVSQRIDEATMTGIRVLACENTMKGHRLTHADMLQGIGYVKAGVVEIMRREQEGWTYIRP